MNMEMKLTAQDYRNAWEVWKNYRDADASINGYFENYCQAKIAELEKPEPKTYKCIKDFSCFLKGYIATEDITFYDIPVTELPFHFELIPEPEKKEPITMKGLVDMIRELNWGSSSFTFEAIIKRIQTDHNIA